MDIDSNEAYLRKRRLVATTLPCGTHIGGIGTGGIEHHAIFCSEGEVIHYIQDGTGSSGPSSGCVVQTWTMRRFVEGFPQWRVVQVPRSEKHGLEIGARAMARLGEKSYNLLFSNCEHFARWCFDKSRTSLQVLQASFNANQGLVIGGGLGAVDGLAAIAAAEAVGVEVGAGALMSVPVAGAIGMLVGVVLHFWGRNRVASRVPICIFNHLTWGISIDIVHKLARLRAKGFQHGNIDGHIHAGMFMEFNPASPDTSFDLKLGLGPGRLLQFTVARGDVIWIRQDGIWRVVTSGAHERLGWPSEID